MKILVLEDDAETAVAVRTGLVREGHEVTVVGGVVAALDAVDGVEFDAAVLDLGLPDGSGFDVLESLRHGSDSTAVLILTARGAVDDRVDGLNRGADDYLVKPFALTELAARLRALERRPRGPEARLSAQDIRVDLLRQTACVRDVPVSLTPIEFGLLAMLVRQRGRTVTRRALLRDVWGMNHDPATNVVDVHVNRVRRKLLEAGAPDAIRTLRGRGYTIE